MVESIDPWAFKVAFWIKIHDFWAPFWHRFFDFFRKGRKCEISEGYNAKRGSEPSKTFAFPNDFHHMFMIFLKFSLKDAMALSPTVVLLDMDGVLVDWDAGFRAECARRASRQGVGGSLACTEGTF